MPELIRAVKVTHWPGNAVIPPVALPGTLVAGDSSRTE
jgi:hypothetical protein